MKQMMKAVVKAKYIKGSARKMRLVMDLVRGRTVEDALNILRFIHKKDAPLLEKIVRCAVANVQNIYGDKLKDPNVLSIIEARCDEGPMLKRIRPRAMGRAFRIRKRTYHVKIVVAAEE